MNMQNGKPLFGVVWDTLFKKNYHNLVFPVQLLRVGRPYFPKLKILLNRELGNLNHNQMSGSEGLLSIVIQIA